MSKANILIVENELILAKDIQNILNSLGYKVPVIATSGEDAIKKVSETCPDLVLMDISLNSDIDGIEAAKQIRNRFNIPIIYLTADTDDATLKRAKKTNPFGFIIKPFEERELRINIEMALYKHKTEEKIRKLSRAVEQTSSTVVITDIKGNIEYVNPRFTQTTGYTPEEAIGKNPRVLKSGVQNPEFYREMWQTISSGNEWRGEFHNKKKNGELYWESASISPIRNEEGVITNFIAVKDDITERKQTEKELLRLACFPKENPNPILECDNEGNIIYANPVAQRIMYLKEGQPELQILPENHKDLIRACIKDTLNVREIEVKFQDHVYLWVYHPIPNLDVIHLHGTDITERKAAESKLKAAMEEAQRANEAKSVFLSSMSHELRTPMNSILGFAQLLESDPTGPLTGSQKENVEQILNSGNHLLELINEVLDLSRIESGKLQISIETIELDQVIEEALTTIEPMVQRYNIKINKKVECDNQYVRADLTRLKQVVINLLSNAIKYNKEYGSVIISCEYPASDTIRLNIEDTGFGISREKLESLFEPFNRLGAETLNIEGTGIGLTITKRLVELMDGSIGVKSKIGEGTKFYVDLKKAEAPVFEDSKVESVLDKKHHKEITERQTLLYVDDNPASLKLVESILKRRHNIDLLTANKAQPGIEIARTNHPDIILMDINLPDIDGYEALKLLKIHDDTKDIPVIAISANAMPKDIEKGKAADFKDYITKPINITKFLHVIDNALTNKVSKVG